MGLAAKYYDYHITRNEWLRVDSAGYTTGGEGEGLVLTSGSDMSGDISSFMAEGWLISRTVSAWQGKNVISTPGSGLRIIPTTPNFSSLRVFHWP